MKVTFSPWWIQELHRLFDILRLSNGGTAWIDEWCPEHETPEHVREAELKLAELANKFFPFPCETSLRGSHVSDLADALKELLYAIETHRNSPWWSERYEKEDGGNSASEASRCLRESLLNPLAPYRRNLPV